MDGTIEMPHLARLADQVDDNVIHLTGHNLRFRLPLQVARFQIKALVLKKRQKIKILKPPYIKVVLF
jgi:hypothetical protein